MLGANANSVQPKSKWINTKMREVMCIYTHILN